MYAFALVAVCLLICFLVAQLNALAAIVLFMLALVSVPALILHRREIAAGHPIGPDGESPGRGALHTVRTIGLDTTGIVLGVLLLIALVLLVRYAGHGAH